MSRAVEPWLVAGLLGMLLVWGVALRLEDPLSTRAIAAEDPYTHIVFTKEWLDQGYFADSFHLGTSMYPPGMHAFVGAFASVSGISLYDFARIAPAFFGGLAILGTFALAARLAGPAAGLAAAFLVTIAPEHIFRTELLFPTALDLALLPLWMLSFVLLMDGERKAGSILFVGSAIPLAIMHPWVVPLFAAPLALYAGLRTIRARAAFRESTRTLALPIALLVLTASFAMSFRWKASDTGFADFLGKLPGASGLAELELAGPLVFLIVLPVLALLAAAGVAAASLLAASRIPRAVRIGASVATGAALLALLVPLTRALPVDVNYGEMFGPILIVAGIAGFALAFLRPTRLGDLGVSIAVPLYPLTALDFFGGTFWPQRTVAYLILGVALLGANVAAQAYDAAPRLARGTSARRAGPATIAALALVAAGSATAFPVDTYEWYRLYDDEEFAGFERAAAILAQDDASRAFVYSWQPALLVKTLASPEQAWYAPTFFSDASEREERLAQVGGPTYVLVDPFTHEGVEDGEADLGFLHDGDRYELVFDEGIQLYEVRR